MSRVQLAAIGLVGGSITAAVGIFLLAGIAVTLIVLGVAVAGYSAFVDDGESA